MKDFAVKPLPPVQLRPSFPCSSSSFSGSVTLSSSIFPHPLFFSSPPAALHPSAEHRYLFRNLSVEIILHLRRSLSTHNYHGQSCRTVLNSAGTPTLMTLPTARPHFSSSQAAQLMHYTSTFYSFVPPNHPVLLGYA